MQKKKKKRLEIEYGRKKAERKVVVKRRQIRKEKERKKGRKKKEIKDITRRINNHKETG